LPGRHTAKEEEESRSLIAIIREDFIIDDSKLYIGVKAFCQIVFDYAKIKSGKISR